LLSQSGKFVEPFVHEVGGGGGGKLVHDGGLVAPLQQTFGPQPKSLHAG
jgi:hypothetical protein